MQCEITLYSKYKNETRIPKWNKWRGIYVVLLLLLLLLLNQIKTCVYYPGHKSRTQEQSSKARRGVNLRQDNPFVQSNFTKQIRKSKQQES